MCIWILKWLIGMYSNFNMTLLWSLVYLANTPSTSIAYNKYIVCTSSLPLSVNHFKMWKVSMDLLLFCFVTLIQNCILFADLKNMQLLELRLTQGHVKINLAIPTHLWIHSLSHGGCLIAGSEDLHVRFSSRSCTRRCLLHLTYITDMTFTGLDLFSLLSLF